MALTLDRSFFCTGDACYLLDDTQPTGEPDPPEISSSSSPPLPHTPSLSSALREPSTSSESAPSEQFDLESYLYGVSGIRWKVDEFDWVYGSRVVRATKLDVPGFLATAPETLQDTVPSAGHNGPGNIGGDGLALQSLKVALPRGRRGNALSLRLPRYPSVTMKHAPLVFNEVLGISLDPYRQVRSRLSHSASLRFFSVPVFCYPLGLSGRRYV